MSDKLNLPGYKEMADLMQKNPRMAYSFIRNISRSALSSQLGYQYGSDRDLYKALGYKQDLEFADYYNMYSRLGIAKKVVRTWPVACWKANPIIKDSGGDGSNPTDFENDINDLIRRRRIFKYLKNADIHSGIGRYAVILKGYDGGTAMSQEVKSATDLLYMRVVNENNAKIKTYETDKKSERYGLPLIYKVTLPNGENAEIMEGKDGKEKKSAYGKEMEVHWTRIQHIAEGAETNDIFGTPRLKCVFNDMFDWMKVTGGAPEMFWRGALGGWAFVADADVDMDEQTLSRMETEIESWFHGMDRYMRLQGVEPKPMNTQFEDPSSTQEAVLNDIAAGTNIPKRKLIGSERGELASSQDESDFNDETEARRDGYVEPEILRPFIDDCIVKGIVAMPKDGKYVVEWPNLRKTSEKEEAEVALTITKAVAEYVKSGTSAVMPPEVYFVEVLGWDKERVEGIVKMLDKAQDDEDADFEDDEDEDDME